MAVIKCKMCGGDLVIEPGSTVAECEYCGSRQTIPTQDNEKKLTLFGRANRLRMNSEFDKASGIYETIVAEFPEEAEAYWGLVLCKYGIEYVDDPADGRKVPTCHRSSFDSVMDDTDFEQAMENADAIARKIYREEAKQIEEIRKGIIEVSGKEKPYDIFICYKETAENGDRTVDSVIAQDVYEALTGKGYRVFFSRITLEDKLGQEYEPYIFAALNSAKIMLAFGTDYEYYNAVWVKNEWSRYLKLMAKDKEKYLIPCYKNIDAYDMPKEFAKLQAQDMGKVGAVQDLLRGIEKILPRETKTEKTVPVVQMSSGGPGKEMLLKRGNMSLEDGAFDEAKDFYNKVLDMDAEDPAAYLGLFMAEIKAQNKEEARKLYIESDYSKNRYLNRAKQFAGDELLSMINEWDRYRGIRLLLSVFVGFVRKTEQDELKREKAEQQRKAAEEAAAKAKLEAEEKEKKHQQNIDEYRSGQFHMTEEQQQEQDRLDSEAVRAEKIAKENEENYVAMPEYIEKEKLEETLLSRQAYLEQLGIFKGKEKKLVGAEIEELKRKISQMKDQLAPVKKAVEESRNAAKSCGETAKAHKIKVNKDNRKRVERELMESAGMRLLENGNIQFGSFRVEYLKKRAFDTVTAKAFTLLEWRVLERKGTRLFLISDKAIVDRSFNENSTNEAIWEKSDLRKWLNGEFLEKAFSKRQISRVVNTYVHADANPKHDTDPGNGTEDKVFLLSIQEVEKYFSSRIEKTCRPIRFIERFGNTEMDNSPIEWYCWWLRSPGANREKVACVTCHLGYGDTFMYGYNERDSKGVRPALWVDLAL